MIGLGALPSEFFFSVASGVSANGGVVAGRSSGPSGSEAFRWTATGGMVGLGDLPGGDFYSAAYALSSDGTTVAGISSSSSGAEAFRWTEGGGMVGLGFDAALGVSADGSVIVGRESGIGAVVWTADDGVRALASILEEDYGLDLDGWFLYEATAVSADGARGATRTARRRHGAPNSCRRRSGSSPSPASSATQPRGPSVRCPPSGTASW